VIVVVLLGAVAVLGGHRAIALTRVRRAAQLLDQQVAVLAADLAASVRTGSPLAVALADQAESCPGRLGDELRSVVDRIRLGWSLDRTLGRWARDHDLGGRRAATLGGSVGSVAALVQACRFATAHGGDLAASLVGVAVAIVDRTELADETRALAAQVRTSTAVLALLPVVGAGVFALVDPRVAHTLTSTTLGSVCLLLAGLLDLAGVGTAQLLVRRSLR